MRAIIVSFTLLMVVFLSKICIATNIDSLQIQLDSTDDIAERVELLIELSSAIRSTDEQQSQFYLERAKTLAIDNNYCKGVGLVIQVEARRYENADAYIQAIDAYESSLGYFYECHSMNEAAYNLYRLCSLYKTIGDFSEALEKGQESLEIYRKMNDLTGLRRIFNALGSVYRYQGDYDQAINYYSRSLEISEQQNYARGVGAALNNWGLVHKLKGDLELALQFYHRSYEVKKEIGSKHSIANYYNNIGIIYLELDSLDIAHDCFRKTLALRQEIDDKKGLVSVYHNFGDYYIKRKEYKTAIDYLHRGIQIANGMDVPDKEKYLYKSLTEAYEEADQPKKALAAYKTYKMLSDSLYSSEKALDFARNEMSFKKKSKLQQEKIKSQQYILTWGIAVAGLLVLFLIMLVLFQRQKSKTVKHKLEAKELKLQQQEIQKEVDVKNKELAAFSMNLAQQSQLTEDMLVRLRKLLPVMKKDNCREIQELIKEVEQSSHNKGWEEFEIRFLQVHEEFYERLMQTYPNLTPNEKRLCAFLKLDMNTKEISQITGQSPHSVNVARTRLRKKLHLNNTDTSLHDFVSCI